MPTCGETGFGYKKTKRNRISVFRSANRFPVYRLQHYMISIVYVYFVIYFVQFCYLHCLNLKDLKTVYLCVHPCTTVHGCTRSIDKMSIGFVFF